MKFNSYVFILAFMPLQIIAYFLSNKLSIRLGKIMLVAGSLIFYTFFDLSLIRVLIFSIVINYLFSKLISRLRWKRLFLVIPVVVNIVLLLYFKYTNFIIYNINVNFGTALGLRDIAQPLGISFFTFQQVAYIVWIFKGGGRTSVLDYLTYILYFPKVLMGPLVEPVDFYNQINDVERKKVNWTHLASGIKLFSFGLFKKVLLADTFARTVAWGYENIGAATAMDWILVMLFYALEIYFDFSGYSDMAVGASLMLNITLPINFDSPYKAVSIRDFWKRWHISLTAFFTKYIYIPLGGSRKGKIFTYINTMIIFLISGVWHGANWTFILWGGLHGLLSVVDRITENKQKKVFEPARWLVSFMLINILWLLFRSNSIQQWGQIIKVILGFQSTAVSDGLINTFTIAEQAFIMNTVPLMSKLNLVRGAWMILFTIISLFICFIPENNYRNKEKNSLADMMLAAGAFLWSFTCLSNESVFIYFDF